MFVQDMPSMFKVIWLIHNEALLNPEVDYLYVQPLEVTLLVTLKQKSYCL